MLIAEPLTVQRISGCIIPHHLPPAVRCVILAAGVRQMASFVQF